MAEKKETTQLNKNQKEIKVEENTYILQKPSARWYLRLTDRHRNRHGVMQSEGYISELLETVVVSPKVTIDDFESIKEMEEVVKEIESFLRA